MRFKLNNKTAIVTGASQGIGKTIAIELAKSGRPLTLRAFYPVRAFPDMPQNKIPMAYSAMQRLYKLASDSRFQIQFPFKTGDVLCFDNRRILHGRNAFDGTGSRHLRGIYIDRDEIF